MNRSSKTKTVAGFVGVCLAGIVSMVAIELRANVNYDPYTFTTFVGGGGGAGSVDGTGSAARFHFPNGITTDSSGNVYVADSGNNTIRKITPGGVVTTFAGVAGAAGFNDGAGSDARFDTPTGMATDSADNIYVADEGNNAIRKITTAGAVTTLAGGTQGSADGTGSAARFYFPRSVATDAAGNVYVADYGNSTIRKVTSAGVVTTLAGLAGSDGSANGSGSAARFSGAQGVATDASGNVYVADTGNSTIRKVTPAGVVTTLAGQVGNEGSDDGTGSNATFAEPVGIMVDGSGNIYVADSPNNLIREITPAGNVTTLAGVKVWGLGGNVSSSDGTGTNAGFSYPDGLALDGSGNIYVSDSGNHAIRKIAPGAVVTTLAGSASEGGEDGSGSAARFYRPENMATDGSGNLYVADTYNDTIRKITPAGVVTTFAGSPGAYGFADGTGSAAKFKDPTAVAADSAGNIFVADQGNNIIRKIDTSGAVTTFAGLAGIQGTNDGAGSAARFFYPTGVAVDPSNNVYVADYGVSTIRKITPDGMVTTVAGQVDVYGSTDGTGTAALFQNPTSLAADASGNIYVADTYNNLIRKMTPDGVVTTLAGQAGIQGNDDGTGSAATFFQPSAVAVDSSGNVYVADYQNYTVRKITAAGVVRTLAGVPRSAGSADGTGNAARFNSPMGIAVDSAGNVYVADSANNEIRKGSVPTGPCPVISLSPASLSDGTLGQAYSHSISAGGGGAPYTYAVTSGSLPAGFTLGSDGTLSGLPLAFSVNTFTVTATDTNGCTGSISYTLAIARSGDSRDTTAPVVTIVSPHNNGAISNNPSIVVSGTAKDTGNVKTGVAVVVYSLNGGTSQLVTTANKFTNWTANITVAPGWNTLTARAVDYRGNSSTTNCVFYYGLPTDVTGAYEGLFYETTGGGAPAIRVQSAGSLSASVNLHRVYSGKVYLNGAHYPIQGTFDLNGNSSVTVSRAKSSKPDLTMNLHMDWTGVSKEMTGTVSCASEGWTSSLVAIWTFKAQ